MTALSPLDAVFASIAALRDRPATTEAKPDDRSDIPTSTTATVVALRIPRPPAQPVQGFFQVFEDHSLDGLIDADHEEAARLWTAGAPAPSGNWSETL
jgi:hypothetical protein